jgi:DNA helicase-2/ATP-dependent DNA helicase PcrA
MVEKLDSSQRDFCEASAGNIRLLAPAGCGKSLSLLFRCLHLTAIAGSHRPRFLVVTFTVAAKQELASRIEEDDRFAKIRGLVEVTTLNSWGFRRIKNVAFKAKLVTSKSDFHFAMLNQVQPIWMKHSTIKDAIAQKANSIPRKLMNLMDSFKSLGFDHERHKNLEEFTKRLDEVRAQGLGPKIDEHLDELAKLGILPRVINRKGEERAKTDARDVYNSFYRFWRDATEHLIQNATFTLEDQKYVAYLDERKKLEEEKYLVGATRYDHVLVDEFQDINPLDLALVKAIVERNRATCTIVGDDDQAIFEWRGATPEYILDPSRFFGTAFQTFTLATNYRSPKNIVEMSQRLIANNSRRVAKVIRSNQKRDAVIEVHLTKGLNEAMDLVYTNVKAAVGQGQSPSRIAIIGRRKSQIIPYQIFFASKDVSFCAAEDLQMFLSETFNRLLGLILTKTRCDTKQIRTQVVEDLIDLCNVVKRYPLNKSERESLRKHLTQAGASSVTAGVEAVAAFRGPQKGASGENMAAAIRGYLQAHTVSDSINALGENFDGLKLDIGRAEDDIFFADPPFLHLAEYATRYGNDHVQFLEDIDRAKGQLAYVPPFEDDTATASPAELWKRPVHLMTALRAKGKEFDSVILLDVNEGIWTHRNTCTLEGKEAERRVFYVAFTRARQRVVLLVSSRIGDREALPSPFLNELGLVIP